MTYTDHPNGSARTTARRLGAMGLLLAIACLAGGWALEIARFGWTDRAGTQKVERAVRQQLDSMIDSLSSVTSAVTARPELVRQGPGDSEVTRQLFELLVQSVEHLLIILFIVIGNIGYFSERARKRREAGAIGGRR